MEKENQLHGRYRMAWTVVGAYMCLASHPGTEKSIWQHYNELRAKLDAKLLAECHDITNTTLIYVCLLPSLSDFPVANVQVVRSLCGRPCNIPRRRPPTATA